MAPEDAEEQDSAVGQTTVLEENEEEEGAKLPEPRTFVKVGGLGPWITKDKAKIEYPVHGSIDVLRTNDIGRKKMLERRAVQTQEEEGRKARKDAAYRQAYGEA